MSTLVAGTYTGSFTKIASAVLAGYSTPIASGANIRSSLFTNGEKGVWFDPSDFSTLFQDSAGTTPVTAVGQPVGLMLDKSQGLVLGSELVTNGTFNTDVLGWTAVAGAITFDAGLAKTTGTFYQDVTTVAGVTYLISFDISVSSSSGYLQVFEGGAFTTLLAATSIISANTVGITLRVKATTSSTRIYFRLASGSAVWFDNISTKVLSGNHATQTTTTKRPILQQDATGRYYLKFDGVDDFMVTPSIDFSGTDKVSVFAGVRKLSDAAQAVVAELTANPTTEVTAAFSLQAPGPSVSYRFVTLANTNGVTADATGLAAPRTSVLSGIGNLNTKTSVLRDNGTIVASSTNLAAPDNNLANAPIYIGMRAGTLMPFNGHLYSLVVRGALSDANQIAASEAYVNSKTGAY